MKNSIWVLLLLCSTVTIAQKPCGNPKIDKAAMALAENQLPAGRAVNVMIRVYFHILKNNDGSNAGASLTQIQQEFQRLQADYAPHNICFAFMGVDSINNSFLNTSMNSDNPAHYNLMAALNVPNCINIYYVALLPGYGGNAFSIPSNFCAIDRSNINLARTISHEVGHCLGLLHTFETAAGEENINGSNCSTAGDRVCDTPADPYSHRNEICFITNGCQYLGFCVDPNGAVNFNPPYNNIMSYWGTVNCMITNFTAGQSNRMSSFIFSSSLLISTISSYDNYYGPVTLNSGTSMQTAINSLSSNGNVYLVGSVRATFQAKSVRANPGFIASPISGKIVLTPATCNY